MSLLSEWTTDKTNMNTVYSKSNDIHGGEDSDESSLSDADYWESLMDKDHKNQWKCMMFDWTGSKSSPYYSHITQRPCKAIHYRSATDQSQNWGWGDNYIGVRECWLYVVGNNGYGSTLWTDDEGCLYVNGSRVATSGSCVNTNVSFQLKPGINYIQIMFSEQSGGDAGYITANFTSNSNILWMYAGLKV